MLVYKLYLLIPASSDLASSNDLIFSAVSPSLGIILRQYSLIQTDNFCNCSSVQIALASVSLSAVVSGFVALSSSFSLLIFVPIECKK